MRISTNLTGPEVNNHVSLQWPSYEQPQGLNLRPQRKQTSWSQALTTGPPPRWFSLFFVLRDGGGVCIIGMVVVCVSLISFIFFPSSLFIIRMHRWGYCLMWDLGILFHYSLLIWQESELNTIFFIFLLLVWVFGQLASISANFTSS